MNKDQAQGLAIVCDLQGLILRVLRNDLNLEKVAPGHLFFSLVENASRPNSLPQFAIRASTWQASSTIC